MRRSNYPLLPAEIRGNLLAFGVYDTKVHWLVLVPQQMWPQFSASASLKFCSFFGSDLCSIVSALWRLPSKSRLPVLIFHKPLVSKFG